jgi:hypothetical protein
MVFRLGIPEKLFSGAGATSAPIQSGMSAGDAWMNITQGGRKIGYARRIHTPTDAGSRFSESIFMRINTMGIVQPLTVRTDAELKPDRTLKFQLLWAKFGSPRGEGCGKNDRSHGGPAEKRSASSC